MIIQAGETHSNAVERLETEHAQDIAHCLDGCLDQEGTEGFHPLVSLF